MLLFYLIWFLCPRITPALIFPGICRNNVWSDTIRSFSGTYVPIFWITLNEIEIDPLGNLFATSSDAISYSHFIVTEQGDIVRENTWNDNCAVYETLRWINENQKFAYRLIDKDHTTLVCPVKLINTIVVRWLPNLGVIWGCEQFQINGATYHNIGLLVVFRADIYLKVWNSSDFHKNLQKDVMHELRFDDQLEAKHLVEVHPISFLKKHFNHSLSEEENLKSNEVCKFQHCMINHSSAIKSTAIIFLVGVLVVFVIIFIVIKVKQ